MVRKLLLIILMFSAGSLCVASAQNNSARQIAIIKSDTSYLYAEATMKDLNEAILGAKAILEMQVSEWVKRQHPKDAIEVCIAKAKEHCCEVHTHRGDYHRAFVYVKKNEILPVVDKNEIVVFQVDNQSSNEVRDQSHERSDSSSSITVAESSPVATSPRVNISEEESMMAAITDFYQVEPFIDAQKQQGNVIAYGKYKDMPDNIKCHLFVYNRKGEIVAVLRRDNNGYINLRTLDIDYINHYKDCGAIWLQLKD